MERTVDLSVVVPVFNEIDNVDEVVRRVRATFADRDLRWELVAVDDGSTDGSGERLDALSGTEPNLRVLHFDRNHGQSAGLDAGFRHAAGRLVAVIDADLQTFPEDLPELVATLESSGADAVVGIRAARQDTGWRKLSSRFANGIRNRLTREDIQDTGCPLKVIRAEAVRTIRPFNGMHRFLPTLLRLEGFRVVQVPVRHAPRTAGASKYGTWDRAFRGLRDALGVRWLQDRHLRWRLR